MSWIEHISPELNMVGAGSCEDEATRPLSKAPDNLLLMVNQGEGILVFNGKKIVLSEGDWIIFPPLTEFKFSGNSETFWAQWLNFNWIKPSLAIVVSLGQVPNGIKTGNISEIDRCSVLWDIIWNRWNSGDICEIRTCNALLLEILIRLFPNIDQHEEISENKKKEPNIPEEQLALLLKRLLDEMPPNQKSIQEVLAGMNLNYEFMTRVFQDNFGTTPLEYLIELRIKQAEKKIVADDDGSGLIRVEYEGGYYAYEHNPKLRRRCFDFSSHDHY